VAGDGRLLRQGLRQAAASAGLADRARADVGWLFFVALQTLGYLSTIFSRALLSIIDAIWARPGPPPVPIEPAKWLRCGAVGVAAMLLLALARRWACGAVAAHRANIFVLAWLRWPTSAWALRLTQAGNRA
jgi:hypothetical protein